MSTSLYWATCCPVGTHTEQVPCPRRALGSPLAEDEALALAEDFLREKHTVEYSISYGAPAHSERRVDNKLKATISVEMERLRARQLGPSVPSREELIEFIRGICEDSLPRAGGKVSGVRAIEFAAWDLYRRLQEAGEI